MVFFVVLLKYGIPQNTHKVILLYIQQKYLMHLPMHSIYILNYAHRNSYTFILFFRQLLLCVNFMICLKML